MEQIWSPLGNGKIRVPLKICQKNKKFFKSEKVIQNLLPQGKCIVCELDCPLLKRKQAVTPKIERPNGKNTKSKFF